jgi:hypothetical protein
MTRDFHLDFGNAGDYAIRGKYGHIYSDGSGFLLHVHTQEVDEAGHVTTSIRRWSALKAKLTPFCRLTQDGDDEGCLRLDHLPSADEAEVIRDAIGIRKRRSLSPEAKAKARAALERFRCLVK